MAAESTGIQTRRDFFNRAAKNWNESLSPEEASFLRSIIDNASTPPELGKQVLDLGCGAGILFPFLGDWNVMAFDISEEMLERARQKNAGNVVEYIQGDANALPFPAEYFAKVMMLAVFPHFDNPLKAMQEIHRVLKPNGVVVLIHLKDAATVNHIHASIGEAIANDRLPGINELTSIMHQAEFEICHSDFGNRVAVISRRP